MPDAFTRVLFWLGSVLGVSAVMLTLGCIRDTPVTGRKQVLLMPENQEVAMGISAFQDVLQSEPVSQNAHYNDMVNRVGQRIAAATGKDYEWEFRVIASPEQNAFCLPGGKVAVYEGILPICQNEAGLAVVMSHEIAHAVARHGGERMTHSAAVNGAKQAVAWVTRDLEETNRDIILKAYGGAANVGFILPYSRKHESEADAMGLVYMSKAGYDPTEAPRFWQRFAAAHQGAEKPAEFLSTHPSDERRAADLERQIVEVRELYVAAPQKFGLGETLKITGGQTMIAQQPQRPGAAGFAGTGQATDGSWPGPPRTQAQPAGWAPPAAPASTGPTNTGPTNTGNVPAGAWRPAASAGPPTNP